MLHRRPRRTSPLQGPSHRGCLEVRTLPRLARHLGSHHLVQIHILQLQKQDRSSPRRA
jgi:hypothetical protein